MEAKDTVMDDATKRQFIYVKNKPDHNLRGFMEDEALQLQAEISFRAGMEEVVGWIEEHGGSFDGYRPEWQAFLKEKGVEES